MYADPALGFACSLILCRPLLHYIGWPARLIEPVNRIRIAIAISAGALSFSVNTSMAFGVVLHIIRDNVSFA